MEVETPLEARESAPVEVIFEALPWIEAAQINIAEDHAAQMRQMGNAALAGGKRGIERDRANDPDEMLHLDRKQKIEINDAIRIDQTIGEQDAVNTGRCADARSHLIRYEKRIENAAANDRDK